VLGRNGGDSGESFGTIALVDVLELKDSGELLGLSGSPLRSPGTALVEAIATGGGGAGFDGGGGTS
jgi:hypothetical protein